MMKISIRWSILPLNELAVVIVLIWAGYFLCLMPEVIEDVKIAKMLRANEEIEKARVAAE